MGGVNCYAAEVDGLTITPSGTTLTISGTGDLTSNATDVAKAITEKISEQGSNYTTVKFVSGSSDDCIINSEIIRSIIYVNYNANSTIEELDLGAVCIDNFTNTTFQTAESGGWYLEPAKLKTIILPKPKKSEGTTKYTIPSGAIYYYDGSHSNVSNNGKNKTVVIPEGWTDIAEGAFYMAKIDSVAFPQSLVSIGKKAFSGTLVRTFNVDTLKSLKHIGDQAFSTCNKLHYIKFNEGLETIGNSAFYMNGDYSQKVLQIPSTVKYIGPAAFVDRFYSDVYFYGKTAPMMPAGDCLESSSIPKATAFSTKILFGNNGFNPTEATTTSDVTAGDCNKGYANRQNYHNNGETYIAVLHFPADCSDTQAATYTDITRKYKTNFTNGTYSSGTYTAGSETTDLKDLSGNYTANKEVNYGYADTYYGEQFVWPSQGEFTRSYVCASNAVCFDGVTPYTQSSWTEDSEEVKLLRSMGYDEYNESTGKGYTLDSLKKIAYMGSRQFVLVSRDVKGKSDEYDTDITTGKRWWTICVPCDVRKSEVDRVFGQGATGTHLCLFSKVTRTEGEGGNTIHLYFQNDTYKNKYERDAETGKWTKKGSYTETDPVVLYAHTPYMIWPSGTNEDKTSYVLKNFELKDGDALSTLVTAGETATTDINYAFVGSYRSKVMTDGSDGKVTATDVTLPSYCYVFGRDNNDTSGKSSKFFFYKGNKGSWKANKCLVERYSTTTGNEGEKDFNTLFKENINSGAKQISTFGDFDDETTGVDRVVFHYGEDSDAPIYNLSGQLVRQNGIADGLAKGIYVQAGKKFIVK